MPRDCEALILNGRGQLHRERLLRDGGRAGIPVVVLMGPLRTLGMFMALQATPQCGPFSVLGFDSKKVVLLDWCFDEAGHLLYQGTAPIFVIVKKKHLGTIIALGAGGSF